MCGIVGLFIKNPALERRLGELVSAMLVEMSRARPGQRRHRRLPQPGGRRASQAGPVQPRRGFRLGRPRRSWRRARRRGESRSAPATPSWSRRLSLEQIRGTGCASASRPAPDVGRQRDRDLQGEGPARATWCAASSSRTWPAATPSATPAWRPRVRSPPSTATPSRPAWICAWSTTARSATTTACAQVLRREGGIEFQTDNDSEVAAGYLTWRMGQGAIAARGAGGRASPTWTGSTPSASAPSDGFAVLRDPIACKHAVLAETDDWVAMATEYRAIARLPGADDARVWEPAPGQVYSWGRA